MTAKEKKRLIGGIHIGGPDKEPPIKTHTVSFGEITPIASLGGGNKIARGTPTTPTIQETPTWQTAYNNYNNKASEYRKKADDMQFSYNQNNDMLYNQYKDHYTRQAQLGMEDAIGRASALTGGYGNSYAMSAGMQAYNARMDELNNIIPDLYQIAYNKFNDDRNALYGKADYYGGLAQQEFDNYVARTEAEAALEEAKKASAPSGVEWGKIPQDVKEMVAKATTNKEMNEIIDKLYKARIIATEEEARALAGYYGKEENFYKKSLADGVNAQGGEAYYTGMMQSPGAWKLAYDGGDNGFGGIDEDAEFVTPIGTTITAKDLYEYLIKEGMSKNSAKAKVIALQEALEAD